MAQVDDRIPLQTQLPQILNPAQIAQFKNQLYANQLNELNVQEAQREATSRNALMEIFKDPANIGEDGMPTRNALSQVMAIDPEKGMVLQNNLVRMQEQRELMQSRRIQQFLQSMQINEAQLGALEKVETGLMSRYDSLIEAGVPKAEAIKIVSEEKKAKRAELAKSGYLTEDQLNRISGQFDPEGSKAFLAASPAYKTYLDEKTKAEETKRKAAAEQRAEERTKTLDKTPLQRAQDLREGYERQGKKGSREWKEADAEVKKLISPTQTQLIQAAPPVSKYAIKMAAAEYRRTGKMPAMGMADRTTRSAILNEAAEQAMEDGQNLADVPAARVEYQALSRAIADRTKYLATVSQFVNNFDKQIALVEKYATSGAANYNAAINKWIQNGRKALTNDPVDVVALDTAIRGAAREHQRIVTGVTSNAQLHATAQETADQLLNKAMTPKAIAAALKVMKEESRNARESGKAELADLQRQIKAVGKAAPGIEVETKPYTGDDGSGKALDIKPFTEAPPVGTIQRGYKFKGGNPADAKNWEKQ